MRHRHLLILLPLVAIGAAGAALAVRPVVAPTAPAALPSSIDRVLGLIRDKYVEPVDEAELVRIAAEAMLRHVGDPYAAFLSGTSLSAYRSRLTGAATGLGLQVGAREGHLTVLAAAEGSPAFEAGLRPGDRILTINGYRADDLTVETATFLLEEAGAPEVPLVVRTGLRPREDSLLLVRRPLPATMIAASGLIGSHTAYVALRGFADGSADAVGRLVDSLLALGADRLILDLRGNLGGRLREGVRLADHFLPDGTVLAERERRGSAEVERLVATGPERWPGLPVSVLVDAGTASAAEIVAGALQGQGRVRLYGTRTYGKSEAQDLFDVGDGTVLRLTTGRWRLPSGDTLVRHQGLVPDVAVAPAVPDPTRARWRDALGDRWPRLEGTLRRFAAGWSPLCGSAAPRLTDRTTWRTLRATLSADSLLVPALRAPAARHALGDLLAELAVRENCGEAAWRLQALGTDPVVQEAERAFEASALTRSPVRAISP